MTAAPSATEQAKRGKKAAPSGRLLLRMPAALHAELAQTAEREGVSLNQFITRALAGRIGWGTDADDAISSRRHACRRPREADRDCARRQRGRDRAGSAGRDRRARARLARLEHERLGEDRAAGEAVEPVWAELEGR